MTQLFIEGTAPDQQSPELLERLEVMRRKHSQANAILAGVNEMATLRAWLIQQSGGAFTRYKDPEVLRGLRLIKTYADFQFELAIIL